MYFIHPKLYFFFYNSLCKLNCHYGTISRWNLPRGLILMKNFFISYTLNCISFLQAKAVWIRVDELAWCLGYCQPSAPSFGRRRSTSGHCTTHMLSLQSRFECHNQSINLQSCFFKIINLFRIFNYYFFKVSLWPCVLKINIHFFWWQNVNVWNFMQFLISLL